ncbi:Fungal specific transcription factor domain [Geosmithia morbida]|uniref:Fungal specific transcription factor domain n=1 Tax=Geosmithia morbida TaxID=1094350 RepID=A0A9P4Z1N3_9HYPO|nr:Fungal specific transcription factor domain [Geosmithia morbida]KAF4125784.1 Fungal specific transcription factor domain [Geosmithia morbida]
MLTAVSQPSKSPRGTDSPMEDPVERAHRACEKCTRTKKKCDKAIPACSRCSRLDAPCCYDYVMTGPTTTVVDPATYGSSGSPNDPQVIAAARYSIFEPDLDVPPAMLMNLLTSRGISWRDSVALYFQTTNLWLCAVHQDRFLRTLSDLDANGCPRRVETAMLIVCMHLVTQFADSGRPTMPDGTEMLSNPIYLVAKRVLGLVRAVTDPSIPLLQASALLCLFEFGHGAFMRAYVTIGDAYTSAKSADVRPGRYMYYSSPSAAHEAAQAVASPWGEYYECFATLLLLLYCSYLCAIDASRIQKTSSNIEISKAIAGINFTIRIIADTTADLNAHLARNSHGLLARCSPVTPFSAYHSLAALSNFEHVVVDADARFHDIYSSLHFFAKRWGVAGQLVMRIESFLATKDEEGSMLDFTFLSKS